MENIDANKYLNSQEMFDVNFLKMLQKHAHISVRGMD